MNLLQGNYWKKQRRELVEIKKLPLRQCIGCRSVRRKDELLRFMRSSLGRMEFDEDGTNTGRGFYLCPKAACFINMYANKRIRTRFFKTKDDVEELIKKVQEALLKLIEIDIRASAKMGYLIRNRIGEDLLHWENLILIINSYPLEAKEQKTKEAYIDLSGISLLPAAQIGNPMGFGVRNDYPMNDRLSMNLMKYGMLSSKGHVL